MPKKLQYTKEALKNALDAMKAGESASKASAEYGVPRGTLLDKFSGRQSESKYAGKPALSQERETKLAEWIVERAEKGFPVVKSELLDTVKLWAKKDKTLKIYGKNFPGRYWFKGFLKRNPGVSLRMIQNLSERRGKITRENIDLWFTEVKEHLTNMGLLEIGPDRIFNCDESGFAMAPKGGKGLAKKGAKSVHAVSYANDHETITCLIMASANGDMPPPLVLFAYKRVPGFLAKTTPDGWAIGCTDKGWMTGECFFEYIVNTFHPWLVKNVVPLPVILYVDGHKSHLTLPLSEFCSSHGIEIIVLFPNATHVIQPLDVGYFSPLKAAWTKERGRWQLAHPREKFNRQDFSPTLDKAIRSLGNKDILRNAFRHCGLFPFNPEAIDTGKIVSGPSTVSIKESQESSSDTEVVCPILRAMEGFIPEEIVNQFQKCEFNIWNGAAQYRSLFSEWQKLMYELGSVARAEDRTEDSVQYLLEPEEDVVELAEGVLEPAEDGLYREEYVMESEDYVVEMAEGVLEPAEDGLYREEYVMESEDYVVEMEEGVLEPAEDGLYREEYVMDDDVVQMTEGILEPAKDSLDLEEDFMEPKEDVTEAAKAILELAEIILGPLGESDAQEEIPPVTQSYTQTISSQTQNAFGDVLFWPKPINEKTEKVTKKQRLPVAATSEKWQEYHRQVDTKKQRLEEEKKEKRQERERKKIEKELMKEEKKKKQEENKLKRKSEAENKTKKSIKRIRQT